MNKIEVEKKVKKDLVSNEKDIPTTESIICGMKKKGVKFTKTKEEKKKIEN